MTSLNFTEHAGGKDYHNSAYTGGWTHPKWRARTYGDDFYYMGGGSGNLINRSTARALVEKVFPVCHNETDQSTEDLYIGPYLRDVLDVTGYDSRDTEGRERFIGVDPIHRAAILPNKSGEPMEHYLWCGALSPKAISFHLVKPAAKMKRFERMFHRMSPNYSEQDCNNKVT